MHVLPLKLNLNFVFMQFYLNLIALRLRAMLLPAGFHLQANYDLLGPSFMQHYAALLTDSIIK